MQSNTKGQEYVQDKVRKRSAGSYSTLRRLARAQRKAKLINAGLLDRGDTMVDVHNNDIYNEGETHRRYLHGTKGYRKINRLRDELISARPFLFSIIINNLVKYRKMQQIVN